MSWHEKIIKQDSRIVKQNGILIDNSGIVIDNFRDGLPPIIKLPGSLHQTDFEIPFYNVWKKQTKTEASIRAQRRAGEILTEQGREQGDTDKTIMSHDVTLSKPKLEELGISRMQSHRWQLMAKVPPDKFSLAHY